MTNSDFPWTRFVQGDKPIYFSNNEPNWFVPNRRGDELLRSMAEGCSPNGDMEMLQFLSRIPESRPVVYSGRRDFLSLEKISELWFHLTNRCNMACAHCLFSSSPADDAELAASRIFDIAREAHQTGCRLFALTGGEPLVHPEVATVVRHLLAYEQTHVVMLTNGLELFPFLAELHPDPDFFHLQISIDGRHRTHDRLRGQGAFDRLTQTCRRLQRRGFPYTLSMCVTKSNASEMPDVVDWAADMGASNLHFMWYFVRGRGKKSHLVGNEAIFENLMRSASRAKKQGIPIDNLEAMKTQVFAPAGTIHDGSTAGWESLAVGPDGRLYPSAALVGMEEVATEMSSGLISAWHNSAVLQQIRKASASRQNSPLRFILGGGDPDHSFLHNRSWLGDDPYEKLHEMTALWLIGEAAVDRHPRKEAGIVLQMGEILESCGAHGKVALVHSNCLLAAAQADSLTTVKTFYAAAAGDTQSEILNPVCYDETLISHIPAAYRFRGYGCGSPVLDADIRQGEHILDLGCGSGVECFIASRLTGSNGRVVGVDMLDAMLDLALAAQPLVAENLHYDNLEFHKGYLEELPVESDAFDIVISNCVMNLSMDKRKAYTEIHRVLRPGGRLVIADIVCETEPDPAIRNDEKLKGECIAGALTVRHLSALLEETGFEAVMLQKRFPYREVNGHLFFSLTYSAVKPASADPVSVVYRGPLPFLVTPDHRLLPRGTTAPLDRLTAEAMGGQLFVLDDHGHVLNVDAENNCACYTAPQTAGERRPDLRTLTKPLTGRKHAVGCMVCEAPLVYESRPRQRTCVYCGASFSANSVCEHGHYVCDRCHSQDGTAVIRQICLHTGETDMVRIFEQIRRHPSIPMHGPEYHAMVPGVILAAFRNLGGEVSESLLEAGIDRGRSIAGGFCGFMGVCGAAVGVGIAFSLLIDANPTKAAERSTVQRVTADVLEEIAKLKAARCCQRDCWIAFSKAAEISASVLPVTLQADFRPVCGQHHLNRECLGKACRLHPSNPL